MMLACVATVLVNVSSEPWKPRDDESLAQARGRCTQLYKDSPCLVKFVKVEPGIYRAICGGKK